MSVDEPKAPRSKTGPAKLRDALLRPELDVMNFLNEIVSRFPEAISFAPGRPHESLFDVKESLESLDLFVDHFASQEAISHEQALARLGQYQRTNGIIHDLVARQVANDEGIVVDPADIMITSGAQEAMAILMLGLFDAQHDALLCADPAYIGMTGPAAITGVTIVGVPTGPEGVEPHAVIAAIAKADGLSKIPRALYLIPDFNNPLGTSIPLTTRYELLEVAKQHGLLIIEDNPYGMFAYDHEPLPTMKALDASRTVVYIGTFAKSVYPGLRIGYMIADQPYESGSLASELSRVKSMTTVTSSPITQALLGGLLLREDCSLREFVRDKVAFYRSNRDTMLVALGQAFKARAAGAQVTWNEPAGGFFLTVDLPFDFDNACLERCARDFGVIACPMSYFALDKGRDRQVRLSFSAVTPPEIETGIERFAEFVSIRMSETAELVGG